MANEHSTAKASLHYHEQAPAGKISMQVHKPLSSTEDLTLAYTPGVASVVQAIAQDPEQAYRYTNKGQMVAVISNGTAVLGLGNTGALASKPVMEGKAALIMAAAPGLSAIDIEIDAQDVDALANIIVSISPSFGGILLEDIKAPECFVLEKKLKDRLKIPFFHDDQHGTSIVVSAALINALRCQNKDPKNCKVVMVGAGAAGYSVFQMFETLGFQRQNIYVYDRSGLIHTARLLDEHKVLFATQDHDLALKEAFKEADVVIGLSGPNLLDAEDIDHLAPRPIIMALSNPVPEVDPALVASRRADAIMCTGRGDFPNQVNNLISFPYLIESMLITRTPYPTEALKWAMAQMIADLQKDAGPKALIPHPLDPRLKDLTKMLIAWIQKSDHL